MVDKRVEGAMAELPLPRNSDQAFYKGICDRLDRQNALLADLCDRLPAPAEQSVTEPEGTGEPQTVELIEPVRPARKIPARKAAARKPAARTAASTRES